jgi:hypothetical protein
MATARQNRHHKKAFLEMFRRTGNISAAVRLVPGLARSTVYVWLKTDAQFEADFQDAELESTEIMEEEAARRAVEGVPRTRRNYHRGELVDEYEEIQYSDTLLMFLLKARAPQKYRERFSHEHSGPDGGPIPIDDARDRLLARFDALVARRTAQGSDHESEQG